MLRTANATGHSALVELRLEIEGRSIPLAQTAGDWIMVETPEDLPPCEGVIIVTVDGREHRTRVSLDAGISTDLLRTPVRHLD